jgi:uncharacterized protein YdhG (YjbR/CyaY superfamily)
MGEMKWQCPKCGRSFQQKNQNHYCGAAAKSVNEYVSGVDEEHREAVAKMCEAIKKAAPEATEKIAWSMPYFVVGKQSIGFSAGKNHISFFIGTETVKKFETELEKANIKHNDKGTVQLKWDNIPFELVSEMARFYFARK